MNTALRLAALSTLAISSFGASFTPQPAQAALFGERAVEQQDFVAVAAPVGDTGRHQLLVLEQQSNRRDCWAENGSTVEPLLLNFDFTGICGRYTDSNGYSIRTAGQDLGVQYNLRTVRQGSDIVLQGVPFLPNRPTIELGRAPYTNDFVRIDLNDGWDFAKRTYQGRTLGHVYLSNQTELSALGNNSNNDSGTVANRPSTPSNPSQDKQPSQPSQPSQDQDWRDEIELTQGQQQEIEQIRQSYLAENGRLDSELNQARQELQEMMIGDASTRQVRRQRNQVERLRQRMNDNRFSSMMEIRQVMSAQQRTAFAEVMDLDNQLADADHIITMLLR
jgi:Spy/CpxP family protein refolding chaperone